jgi:hypothetical protein
LNDEPSADAPGPGHHVVLPGQSPDGRYVLGVLLKRSYRIVPGGACVRVAEDAPLVPGDVHWGDPLNSTVKFESDFVPYKLATDVVVVGTAYAPGGRPVPVLDVAVSVGAHRKSVRVLGDRRAVFRGEDRDPGFTEPEPFATMPLRYERAYGGIDVRSNPAMQSAYGRNHLGRGWVVANTKAALDGLPLPNLEDPADLLEPARLCCGHFMHWERQPMPAGIAWFSKYWRPRAGMAGVMPADRPVEQELRRAYARFVPPEQRELYAQTGLPDMDFRFFNGASPGLVLPWLDGSEEVVLEHLAPQPRLAFRLPGETPAIGLDIGEGPKATAVRLHTVQVRADDGEVDLVWRSAHPYPGPDWLPKMTRLDVIVG